MVTGGGEKVVSGIIDVVGNGNFKARPHIHRKLKGKENCGRWGHGKEKRRNKIVGGNVQGKQGTT